LAVLLLLLRVMLLGEGQLRRRMLIQGGTLTVWWRLSKPLLRRTHAGDMVGWVHHWVALGLGRRMPSRRSEVCLCLLQRPLLEMM